MNKNKADLVIGLDSSTTGVKAIAWNKTGQAAAYAREPINLFSPQPHYYEQNSEDWWICTCKVLKKITQHIDPGRIKALAISNQRETFAPLDKQGNPIRPAIVWLDERCKSEVERFAQKIGKKRIHNITGKPVDYAPVVYRLAWMKNNEADSFGKIHMVCDVQTYLVWKLTGLFKTSWASADPLGLFDVKNKTWSLPLLQELGLREDQLPETCSPGAVLGRLAKRAAACTGLVPDTLIIAGGGDGQAAGLGVNVLSSDRAYLNLGTAAVAGIYGSDYRISRAFRTMCSCSDSGYYYECSLRSGTFTVDWFVRNILKIDTVKQSAMYTRLEQEAQATPAGSQGLLYLPYLCGVMNPYWDINARGALIGLSASHTREHMYRAFLEGIAFEQTFAMEHVEKAVGTRVHTLTLIGGGSSSELWCRIIADITGRNVCLPRNSEASCLGAAIAAAVGSGWYRSFAQAAKKMTEIKKILKPDMHNYHTYTNLFNMYKKIYPNLKNIGKLS